MCSFDINYKNYKLSNSFFDFHSLSNLKEIKIQNSKILTMNPETFKVLTYLNSNTNDTIKYSGSNNKSIKEQEEVVNKIANQITKYCRILFKIFILLKIQN